MCLGLKETWAGTAAKSLTTKKQSEACFAQSNCTFSKRELTKWKGGEKHGDSVHSRVCLSLAKDTIYTPWIVRENPGVNSIACKALYDLALSPAPWSLPTPTNSHSTAWPPPSPTGLIT